MYLHKMILKRFKERPLLYSCLSTAASSASGLGFGMDFALYRGLGMGKHFVSLFYFLAQ